MIHSIRTLQNNTIESISIFEVTALVFSKNVNFSLHGITSSNIIYTYYSPLQSTCNCTWKERLISWLKIGFAKLANCIANGAGGGEGGGRRKFLDRSKFEAVSQRVLNAI